MLSLNFVNAFWTVVYVFDLTLARVIAPLPRRVTRGPLDAPDE
jgi:hypothetical protein